MYFVRTPSIIKPLGRDFLWNYPRYEKNIYLTFDDGPTPGVTEKVLELLSRYDAKATFFCLGKNVMAHTELWEQVRSAGHVTGNHSWSHPDGWKTCTFSYVKDVLQAQERIRSPLFRPPYGRITMSQSSLLKKKFRIVMWDVISADFDESITEKDCADNVLKHAKNGSIVVFHDNERCAPRCLYALEKTLEHYSALGYRFCKIEV